MTDAVKLAKDNDLRARAHPGGALNKGKVPREYKKMNSVEHLTDFIEWSGWPKTRLCQEWGLSSSVIALWIREGKCPFWTVDAIDGLRRRMGDQGPEPEDDKNGNHEQTHFVISVIRVPEETDKIVRGALRAMGVKIFRVNIPLEDEEEDS